MFSMFRRKIFLDTETTGLSAKRGHRIIEIAAVEELKETSKHNYFHSYVNPEREIDQYAEAVHGISYDLVKDKPVFSEIIEEFIGFIYGAEVFIHNSKFDQSFINNEFKLMGFNKTLESFCKVTDTLKIARKLHPRESNSLDALCLRYSVDDSARTVHGALITAEILAIVYSKMKPNTIKVVDTISH